MKTPTMVVKYPGPHQFQDGKYDWLIVDEADVEAALADGWFRSPAEARAAADAHVLPKDPEPPTRAELEQKATELGIKWDGRWGDKKIADMIAATLEA